MAAEPETRAYPLCLRGLLQFALPRFLLPLALGDLVLFGLGPFWLGPAAIVALVVILLGLTFGTYDLWYTRLIVSPTGITYRTAAYRISARWQDVTAWIASPELHAGTSGFHLRAAQLEIQWWAKPSRNHILPDYLPLSVFANPIEGTPLGQHLQHYIPHVLAPGSRPKRKAAPKA